MPCDPLLCVSNVATIIVHTVAYRSLRGDSECLTVMVGEDRFDVFLSHNSADKPMVRRLEKKLQARGLRVWLDESQLVPGRPWQEALESIISKVGAVAVLIGGSGVGPWETPEMRACLQESVRRGLSVIPVLLPGAPAEPELPVFLREFTWVDLRGGLRKKGIDRLHWGITADSLSRADTKGPVEPMLRVVHPDAPPLPHPKLLRDLTKSITAGELRDSLVGPLVLAVLKDERRLEVLSDCDSSWLTVGIRLSDEYFVRVWESAGERDWQRDFAQIVTPVLVSAAHLLKRSPTSQALMIKLCRAVAERLRLTLVWPKEADGFNDMVNGIYRACLKATELESDDVLVQLKGLLVTGPV